MIALACDNRGLAYKHKLTNYLDENGLEYKDFGCYKDESCDYPDYAAAAARAVASGECDRGILICYTGIGMSIAANKVKGVRCALCGDTVSAEMTRLHNDSNMLAVGAGITGELMFENIVKIWLATCFEGGRHQRRVDKIKALEE